MIRRAYAFLIRPFITWLDREIADYDAILDHDHTDTIGEEKQS